MSTQPAGLGHLVAAEKVVESLWKAPVRVTEARAAAKEPIFAMPDTVNSIESLRAVPPCVDVGAESGQGTPS